MVMQLWRESNFAGDLLAPAALKMVIGTQGRFENSESCFCVENRVD